jgi:hypothetical protein
VVGFALPEQARFKKKEAGSSLWMAGRKEKMRSRSTRSPRIASLTLRAAAVAFGEGSGEVEVEEHLADRL